MKTLVDTRLSEELTRLQERIAALEREAGAGKRTAQALRESRELFQCFMANSPVFAYMKDEKGRYVYANRMIDTVLGDGRPVEWRGKTDHDLWPPETAAELRANDQGVLQADRTLKLSETLPQADGDHHWLSFKFPFTTISGKRYLAGISLDITERTRFERERAELLERRQTAHIEAEAALAALRQSETRARRLFESSIIGIIEMDRERICDANDSFLSMVGYTREELRDGKLRWREMTPRKYHAAEETALYGVLSQGACPPFEKELLRKDGRTIPILMGATVLENAHGDDWKCVAFVLDLTDRKQLEDRLLHSQKLESLGLLAGGIAHDFNNLLASIMGNASLSLDALSPEHPAYRTLDEVLRASRRASDLTQQLLAYSGRGQLVTKPTDLSALVREIGSLMETTRSKKVKLRHNLVNGLPYIEADPAQIQQVIMNLVINGAESIDNTGEVVVTTGEIEPDVELLRSEGLAPGKYVQLQVTDNGRGMNDETKARIFDPFFTTKMRGHGLGLAAVLGIVRSHRGLLQVDSTLGQGTTFTVMFPASASQPAMTQKTPSREALWGSGLVLVADDEESVRRMTKATLERFGYKVMLAENGKEAVDIYSRMGDQIALVIMDLAMPVMNGDEAVKRLVQVRPGVRVLMCSGYNVTDTMELDGIEHAAFLQKPYTASQLAEAVKGVLEKTT